MLTNILKDYIPEKVSRFKLLKNDSFYNFLCWEEIDELKLIYTFPKKNGKGINTKYIYIHEFINFLKAGLLSQDNTLVRTDFITHCKKSNTIGPCGYCIMIRLIEVLEVGNYLGIRKGVQITNTKRLSELLYQ